MCEKEVPRASPFSIITSMKQKIPGILFLLAMPLSVLLYIKVEAVSGSEILGLFAAVALYVVVALVIALLFNRKDSDRT
jgi:hypothetical protein